MSNKYNSKKQVIQIKPYPKVITTQKYINFSTRAVKGPARDIGRIDAARRK